MMTKFTGRNTAKVLSVFDGSLAQLSKRVFL